MEPRLESCGNYIEIKDFVHRINDEKSGNPYNCSFNIEVKSGMFAGLAEWCEADYKEVKRFIEQLEDLLNFKVNKVTFTEIGYGSSISFQGDRLGHITVSGKIYGHAMIQHMVFEFSTDQTAFPSFIAALKKL